MAMLTNTQPIRLRGNILPVLFTCTIFLSAALLFFVQPLFTKIVLPKIGGAPAVWTTAMLFFQTVLIAGYLYAHLSSRYLPVRAQMGLHLILWACALSFLPLSVAQGWQFDPSGPIALQTLMLFALGVGAPFAVLSANAPLIQSWYAKSGGPSADDPYFLYGASNLGSLIALLGFPLLAEPFLGAGQIGWLWAAGFVVLGAFLGMSGLAAGRNALTATVTATKAARPALPKARTFAWWLFLAFIPSSLMLAVTSKISTDIGSFPLVWVIPLSLYLLTFVMTFTNRPWIGAKGLRFGLVVGAGILALTMTGLPLGHVTLLVTGLLVLAFFAVALFAHRTLYDARPDGAHLTLFYVTMSVGGALGGLFNSLLAPTLFADLHEARITVILIAVLFLAGQSGVFTRANATRSALTALVVTAPLLVGIAMPDVFSLQFLTVCAAVLFTFALLITRKGAAIPAALVVGMVLAGSALVNRPAQFEDRSFFGVHRVQDTTTLRLYTNGTTVHGAQRLADLEPGARPTPLTYYHPDAPMAQVLRALPDAQEIGVVGLGVGSLACYATPGQNWQFYEIDPMVDRVARDPSLFTFMSTCAGNAPTHIGDARIVLEGQTDTKYDILFVDAYSSDAVPVHLTTLEAMALYRDRLTPTGIVVFHITNRYYALHKPIGRAAAALGMTAMIQDHKRDATDPGSTRSTVAVLARDPAHLASLGDKWQALPSDGGAIWTDDRANLLSVLK